MKVLLLDKFKLNNFIINLCLWYDLKQLSGILMQIKA